MKIRLTYVEKVVLEKNRNSLLMSKIRKIFTYTDLVFKEEEIPIKNFFGITTGKTKKIIYLVSGAVNTYSKAGEFVGELTDDEAEYFFCTYNTNALRKNWIEFKTELEAFGFTVERTKPQTNDNQV